jgi:hypothetical protein
MPTVTEVTEEEKSTYDFKTKKWDKHYERFLFPVYDVSFTYDYGSCCGIDYTTTRCSTKADADALVAEVLEGRHSWIKYDPDYMEDDDDEL